MYWPEKQRWVKIKLSTKVNNTTHPSDEQLVQRLLRANMFTAGPECFGLQLSQFAS